MTSAGMATNLSGSLTLTLGKAQTLTRKINKKINAGHNIVTKNNLWITGDISKKKP